MTAQVCERFQGLLGEEKSFGKLIKAVQTAISTERRRRKLWLLPAAVSLSNRDSACADLLPLPMSPYQAKLAAAHYGPGYNKQVNHPPIRVWMFSSQ